MKTTRTWTRRLAWALLTGTSALLLIAGLSLLLCHFQALAQPAAEATAANLVVQKEVNTDQAAPGDTLTYTITVRNTGDTSTDAWLTDTLPTELTYAADSLTATFGSFGVENNVITWTAELYGYNYTAVITFSTRISSEITDAEVVNTAQVTGTGELITDSAETLVQAAVGNLEAFKSVYPSWARPGEYLTYTVRVVNTGNGAVETAWMTDTLPSEVSYASGLNATTGSWGVADDVITWTGSLAPSDAATVTFAVQITSTLSENTRFTNTAAITGTGNLVEASVEATAITTFKIYLPLIFRNYPPVPVLNDIPEPAADNSYTVSWQPVSIPVDRYVLQEATDADFANVTQLFTTTATSQFIQKGPSYGTFYYRVRADNDARWGQGPWSEPKSVDLPYFDDFSDSGSGWPDDKGLIWYEEGLWDVWWRRGYRASEGQYRIKIDNGPAPVVWFWQPDALAPYSPPGDKYCVETSVKFNPPYGWWANAGLVFGANEDNTDIYALCLGVGAEPHLGWFLLRNPEYEFPRYGCAYVQGKIAEGEEGTNYYGWNRLQVSVNGDRVEVYVGGVYVGKWTMPGLSATTRVGVIGGDYEVSDNDIRFDYFRVIPNASCTP